MLGFPCESKPTTYRDDRERPSIIFHSRFNCHSRANSSFNKARSFGEREKEEEGANDAVEKKLKPEGFSREIAFGPFL